MFDRVLNILFAVETPDTFGGKASLALTTLLLGMLTVFGALLIIMVVIRIIGAVFQYRDKKAKEKAAANNPPAAVDMTEQPPETEAANEEELVAAITAAVAVYTEQPVGSFRVVSFKKTSAIPAWNKK